MVTLLAGIDAGSACIRIIVAEVSEDGTITVTGRGESQTPPSAAYMGAISNQKKYSGALKKVIEEVEVMAGFELDRAFVGISSPQFQGMNAVGRDHIQGRHRKVMDEDKDRVLSKCTSIQLPETHEIFTVIPMEYQLDGQTGILEPLNMVGQELSVKAHVITCPRGITTNVMAACNAIGIRVMSLIYEPLGAYEAVVTPEERELGCLFLDIGYDTTHALLMSRHSVEFNQVLRVGGRHFTTDLAQVLGISQREANIIKTSRATLIRESIAEDEAIELTTVGQGKTKVVTIASISEVLYDRADEMLDILLKNLQKKGLQDSFKGGCVVVGGGSKLDGILDLIETKLSCSARTGVPRGISGLTELINDPEWATAVGVMLYGYKYQGPAWKKKDGLMTRVSKIFKRR